MIPKPDYTAAEVRQKLERYCSYQERCHADVTEKLKEFVLAHHQKEEIIVQLIQHNFLNEERFACLFAISKFHQKKWGRVRIKNELKARKISDYLISKSIKEIPSGEYQDTFDLLAERHWETIAEKNLLKKRKKFCDYMLRKGWESDWVYEKAKQLEGQ